MSEYTPPTTPPQQPAPFVVFEDIGARKTTNYVLAEQTKGTFVAIQADGKGEVTRVTSLENTTRSNTVKIDCSALNAPEPQAPIPTPTEIGNGRMGIAQQTAQPPATKATLDNVFGAGTGDKVEAVCKKVIPAAPKP